MQEVYEDERPRWKWIWLVRQANNKNNKNSDGTDISINIPALLVFVMFTIAVIAEKKEEAGDKTAQHCNHNKYLNFFFGFFAAAALPQLLFRLASLIFCFFLFLSFSGSFERGCHLCVYRLCACVNVCLLNFTFDYNSR